VIHPSSSSPSVAPAKSLVVNRNGEISQYPPGQVLKAGDIVMNNGSQAIKVAQLGLTGQATVATLAFGDAVEMRVVGNELKIVALSEKIELVQAEATTASDAVVVSEAEAGAAVAGAETTTTSGLFGAAAGLGGGGLLAASAGVVGVGVALAGESDDTAVAAGGRTTPSEADLDGDGVPNDEDTDANGDGLYDPTFSRDGKTLNAA